MGQGGSKIILWDEIESSENNSLPLSDAYPYQCLVEHKLARHKGGTASKVSGCSWLSYMWLDIDGNC